MFYSVKSYQGYFSIVASVKMHRQLSFVECVYMNTSGSEEEGYDNTQLSGSSAISIFSIWFFSLYDVSSDLPIEKNILFSSK